MPGLSRSPAFITSTQVGWEAAVRPGVVGLDFQIAVHSSGRQLQRSDVAGDVAEALARAGLRPRTWPAVADGGNTR